MPLHVDDYGNALRVTILKADNTAHNVTGCDVDLVLTRPDGTSTTVGASIVTGTAGLVQYIFADGVLDQAGTWRIQGIVDGNSALFHTDIETFEVADNL